MTNEIFNYFANAIDANDENNDATMHLHCAIDEMCFRLDMKMSHDERREIVNDYIEMYDDEFNSSFEFVSYLHAYAFVITRMYDEKKLRDDNARAYARGDMF